MTSAGNRYPRYSGSRRGAAVAMRTVCSYEVTPPNLSVPRRLQVQPERLD
jgi:hypothetical protein